MLIRYKGHDLLVQPPQTEDELWQVIVQLDSKPIGFVGRGAAPDIARADALAHARRAIDDGGVGIQTDDELRVRFRQHKGRHDASDFIDELKAAGRYKIADEFEADLAKEGPPDGNTTGFIAM